MTVRARQRDALVEALADETAWPEAAAKLLARLGFLLLERDGSGGSGSHLLVALRDRPSLRHFDPESISYYAPDADGASRVTIDRGGCAIAPSRPLLWGHVHVVDRIPVENRFLTFGGKLRTATIDPSLTVVDLHSPAPIVRWGGHSQGTDGLAAAIGAFFGRLIVPVDFVPGAAGRVDALPPEALFAAFLADAAARGRRAAAISEPTELDRWLARAWARVRLDRAATRAGARLLEDLGLDATGSVIARAA